MDASSNLLLQKLNFELLSFIMKKFNFWQSYTLCENDRLTDDPEGATQYVPI